VTPIRTDRRAHPPATRSQVLAQTHAERTSLSVGHLTLTAFEVHAVATPSTCTAVTPGRQCAAEQGAAR
jgi:hypothetical protein